MATLNNETESLPLIYFGKSPTVLQTCVIAVIGAVLLARLSQRLRLRLPPGPFAWPVVGNLLQLRTGLTPQKLAKIAQNYGDVFLLQMGQKKVLVVSSPDTAKQVLQTQGAEFGSRARNLVFDMTSGQGQDLVFADYGEHWRKMKRIAAPPFFSSKVVQQFRHVWEAEVSHAISDIETMPGATSSGLIIKDRLQLMLYNIVYQMMFQRSFSGLDDPLYVQLMSLNHNNTRLAQSFKYMYGDFLPFFKPFLKGYLKDVSEANQRRLGFLRDAFLNEICKKKQSKEMIGAEYVLDAHSKGEINENNVLYLMQNMNVAAIDTTMWSTEWGVAELVNNPHIQKKIVEELDSVLGKGVTLTEPDLRRLPYLQAVVKEILRMHMVVPMLLPHMNPEPAKLNGYDIPAGCRVLVNAWGIANDPRYWEKPEVFNPDRFLDNHLDPTGNDFRYIPFGSGRRSCPGILIALPLLGLVLGRLVQAFELCPPPGIDKVDLRSVGGQLSLSIVVKTTVVVKRRSL